LNTQSIIFNFRRKMLLMNRLFFKTLIGWFYCALLLTYPGAVMGQANSSPSEGASGQSAPADQPAALQTFRQEQSAIVQEVRALLVQGATPEQMKAWRAQNADRLAAQQQRAQDLAAASAAKPLSIVSEIAVPDNASPELTSFLATQADLYNRFAQLHNQQTPRPASVFMQQNAAELQAYAQQAQTVAAQAASSPIPDPGPPVIPSDATPQMQAYLTQRRQLLREEIALRNQYLSAEPAVRNAAIAQWRQQNASRFQQMQEQAQNLTPTPTN